MSILVTGGAGYVGSHICLDLLQSDNNVTVVDSLENSTKESLLNISKITNIGLTTKETKGRFSFYHFDLRDETSMEKLFKYHKFEAIIHCAGLKSPEESKRFPLSYANSNISASIHLFRQAIKNDVKNIIFSSSASVYGKQKVMPIKEDILGSVTNPYARTKLIIEQILSDLHKSRSDMNIICLRYFNPVGAHESGLIGENPKNLPNNLMPRINNVVSGQQKELLIYGNDYQTKDGTGVRDYIHIIDLAKGHQKALDYIKQKEGMFNIFNLGRGKGSSVLEIIKAYEQASGVKIAKKITKRRPGDVPESWASVSKAKKLMGWEAKLDLQRICEDNWRWFLRNQEEFS